MICPRCHSNQTDEIKFCTACGANLEAVREALERPETPKLGWNDTWVAEMFMSGKAAQLRKQELERAMGITPEVKRYQEIKAGVTKDEAESIKKKVTESGGTVEIK